MKSTGETNVTAIIAFWPVMYRPGAARAYVMYVYTGREVTVPDKMDTYIRSVIADTAS